MKKLWIRVLVIFLLYFVLTLGYVFWIDYTASKLPHPTYEQMQQAEDERLKKLIKPAPEIQKNDTTWMDEHGPSPPKRLNNPAQLNTQEFVLDDYDDDYRGSRY